MVEGEGWPGEDIVRKIDREKTAELDPLAKEKLDLERRVSSLDNLVKNLSNREYPHPNDIKSAIECVDDLKARLEAMLERSSGISVK